MTKLFASSTSRIRIKISLAVTLVTALFSLSLFAVASFERSANAATKSSCRISAKREGAKSVLGRKRTVFVRKMIGTKSNPRSIMVKRVLCQPNVERSDLARAAQTQVVPTTVPQALAFEPLDTVVVVSSNTGNPVIPVVDVPLAAPAAAEALPVPEAVAVAVPVIVSPNTSSTAVSTTVSTSAPANSVAPDGSDSGVNARLL